MAGFLAFFARHGRMVLVGGLIAGVLLPDFARLMKPHLPSLVAALLFVAALRIGPDKIFGTLKELPGTVGIVLLYQIAVPLTFVILFYAFGIHGPTAFAVILMTGASSISGAPNLVILTGNNAAPAMRLLIIGTALLPLTVLPVLWAVPQIGDVQSVLFTSGRLLALIAVSTIAAFALRRFIFPNPQPMTLQAFDGLSAITMAVVVVGLMSAVGPALSTNLPGLLKTLAAACAVNLGLQLFAWAWFKDRAGADQRVSYSIIAGNRNMALFLAALPVSVTDPILLFIGCYQVPMYLTPILLARLYRQTSA